MTGRRLHEELATNPLPSPAAQTLASLLAEVHAALRTGDVRRAEAGCRDALARFGPRADVLANLASVMLASGRAKEAVAAFQSAHATEPGHAGIAANYGLALLHDAQGAAAVPVLRRAVMLDPRQVDAWNNLGLACSAVDDAEGAASAFAEALAREPRYAAALSNWCDLLIRHGQLDHARDVAQHHVSRAPDVSGMWYKLGYVLVLADELAAARAAFDHALALEPRYAPTHHNLGTLALWQNALLPAIDHFRAGIALDPAYADAKFGLACALLKLRRANEGWEAFEARYALHDRRLQGLQRRVPTWNGTALPNGTLLVLPEEGLGDVLQFARFLRDARQRVGRLVVYCDGYWAPLSKMLAKTAGVDAVVDVTSSSLAVTAACRLMSLPHLLGLGDAAFAPCNAYVSAPGDATRAWATRFGDERRLRVGLCWSGNPRPHERNASFMNRRRSLDLAQLSPLREVKDVRFVSLQKGGADAIRRDAPFPIDDWTDELEDYSDTAALMANLDLVVSVDTSIVHCAGATGRPVWMLDRFDNCWRWGTEAANPGWYASLRVFRQPRFGEWEPAVMALRDALESEAAAHAGGMG